MLERTQKIQVKVDTMHMHMQKQQQQQQGEAALSVLKQSLALARRRGHDQVTPLHVASILLNSTSSPTSRLLNLRRACSIGNSSHSHHPNLQFGRALDLCFNVALNRLPATSFSIDSHHTFSNALIAAIKRARANHKAQQPRTQNMTVELEQLILSILDDPTVGRVMREAGLSSSLVKSILQTDLSSSSSTSPSSSLVNQRCSHGYGEVLLMGTDTIPFPNTHLLNYSCDQNPYLSFTNYPQNHCGDLKPFMRQILLNRKNGKNSVVILSGTDDVPHELKSSHFIQFHFVPDALRFMGREDVEMNLIHLKRKVIECVSVREEAIIYAGDLKWIVCESGHNVGLYDYSPVDHLVSGVGKLLDDYNNSPQSMNKVWLMATTSYQTYIKCRMKLSSLETQWSLEPVYVLQSSSDELGLSLGFKTSTRDGPFELKRMLNTNSCNSRNLKQLGKQQSCNFEASSCWTNKGGQTVTGPRLDHLRECTQGRDVNISLALESSRKMTDRRSVHAILEENVPWQSEKIHSIVESLFDSEILIDKETWFLIQGKDLIGKRRLALAIADSVFGSTDHLCILQMNIGDTNNRAAIKCSEMNSGALKKPNRLVVFIEYVDLADAHSIKLLMERFRTQNIERSVFILTTEDDNKMCQDYVVHMKLQVKYFKTSDSDHKRKARADVTNGDKNSQTKRNRKVAMTTNADEFSQHNLGSSNVAFETRQNTRNMHVLFKSIENHVVFVSDISRTRMMNELIMSKIRAAFEELLGHGRDMNSSCIMVEEKVLDGLRVGSCCFLNSLFEKWLKEVFQRSLQGINIGASVKLCLGRNSDTGTVLQDGYMGSCLPKNIHVSLTD